MKTKFYFICFCTLLMHLRSKSAYCEEMKSSAQTHQNSWASQQNLKDITGYIPELTLKRQTPIYYVSNQYGNFDEIWDIPESWNWQEVSDGLTPVKNQGICKACHAFAVTALLESKYKILYNQKVSLSEQEIISCAQQQFGCGGGNFFDLNYQIRPGQSLESEFPYVGRNTLCPQTNLSHTYHAASWAFIGTEEKSPSVSELKKALLLYGPLVITMTANADFQMYNEAEFNAGGRSCTPWEAPNHMVLLVGWNAHNQWIIKNSWGDSWGKQGYGEVSFQCLNMAKNAAFMLLDGE